MNAIFLIATRKFFQVILNLPQTIFFQDQITFCMQTNIFEKKNPISSVRCLYVCLDQYLLIENFNFLKKIIVEKLCQNLKILYFP